MIERIWHKGPPPHVGWWNASFMQYPGVWRWWNGRRWSLPRTKHADKWEIGGAARHLEASTVFIEWTDYWPEGARVPRVDPRSEA